MKIQNTNLTILLVSVIMLTSFSSALGDIGIVKQRNCIELYNFCPTCSYINLTLIQYPDGTIDNTLNEDMTKSGNDYNYTFCDTEILGGYSYTTCGDKAGVVACEDITFTSTPSGDSETSVFYFLILILSLGVMALGFFLRDAVIVILSSFGLYFVGLYILFNGIDGFKDPVYTWAIGIIILMIAAYISIRSSYELIVD